MAQRKNPNLDAQHQAILRKMMQLPENKTCADCCGPSPRWASTNLGVFLCISCSGIHRKLGTHISKVRSITLDTWTPSQIAHFQKYGNAKAAKYFEACLPENFRRPNSSDMRQMELFIREKYEQKRYITVENGGLGGQGGSGGSAMAAQNFGGMSSSFARNPPQSRSRNTLGARPIQSTYNTGNQFQNGSTSQFSRFGTKQQSSTVRSTPSHLNTSFSSTRQTNDLNTKNNSQLEGAMRRASTLREIMNMGFSSDIAARAVEASDGDLKRALDWVLNQNNQSKPTGKTINQVSVKTPIPNMLSDVTISPPNAGQPSKQQFDLFNDTKVDPPPKTNDAFTDFADFGDFESALPTLPAKIEKKSPLQSSNVLSGDSLRKLYEQGPKPVNNSTALRTAALSPQMRLSPRMHSPLQKAKPQSPISALPKAASPMQRIPGLSQSPHVPSLPQNATGLTTASNGISNLSTTLNKPLTSNLKKMESKTSTVVASDSNLVKNGMKPPPPPPEEAMTLGISNIPPPPTAPPPKETPSTQDEDESKTNCLEKEHENSDEKASENINMDKTEEKSQVEEADPFAALSMMALSSAKSNINNKNAKNASSISQSANTNLDELLG